MGIEKVQRTIDAVDRWHGPDAAGSQHEHQRQDAEKSDAIPHRASFKEMTSIHRQTERGPCHRESKPHLLAGLELRAQGAPTAKNAADIGCTLDAQGMSGMGT